MTSTPLTGDGTAVLTSPVWAALRGPHRRFAATAPGLAAEDVLAVRYLPEVAGFAALRDAGNPQAWDQLALLIEPGRLIALSGPTVAQPPPGWRVTATFPLFQLINSGMALAADDQLARAGDELISLTSDDVDDMLKLVELTQPGPFLPRTAELGGYLGIRRDSQLVAMAGRRMQPPGWAEVSAVCTHPDHRGRGLSRRLINAVVTAIEDDGLRAFLHVTQGNPAAAMYYRLGFSHRTDAVITVLEH